MSVKINILFLSITAAYRNDIWLLGFRLHPFEFPRIACINYESTDAVSYGFAIIVIKNVFRVVSQSIQVHSLTRVY